MKRVGQVDDNLIFGRGKKSTANLFKENQAPATEKQGEDLPQ